MLNLKEGTKLSKNAKIVFEFFYSNPFKAFNVNDLLEVINRDEMLMSKRTIFRVIKKLSDMEKIYCSDINKGMRSFMLLRNDYYVMNCQECGFRKCGKILDESAKNEILNIHEGFCIKRFSIDIRGVCGKCCRKSSEKH